MSQGGPNTPPADPSMDDILASIRRILDDDGETNAAEPAAATRASEEEVFQLDHTMMIEEPPPHYDAHAAEPAPLAPREEDPFDAVQVKQAPPAFMAEPTPVFTHQPEAPEPLVAPETAAAAGASIGALVRVLGQRQTSVYRGGPTLEDIVRDEIRPLVKNWLDEHLPPMVERMVRAEIERVINHSV